MTRMFCPQESPQLAVVTMDSMKSSGIPVLGRPMKHQCQLCGKWLSTRQGLVYHENQHRGIFPYYCPYCSKGMAGTSNLKYHMVEHVGQQGFLCTHCKEEGDTTDFGGVKSLRRHLEVAHGYTYSASGQKILGNDANEWSWGSSIWKSEHWWRQCRINWGAVIVL